LILLIVFCSIYGYVTLDVCRHMFCWLEGIEYQVSTSHTYHIRLCEVQQFYMLYHCLIRTTASYSQTLPATRISTARTFLFGTKFLHYIRHKLPHTTATTQHVSNHGWENESEVPIHSENMLLVWKWPIIISEMIFYPNKEQFNWFTFRKLSAKDHHIYLLGEVTLSLTVAMWFGLIMWLHAAVATCGEISS
jgi:hypothetical protein